MALMSSTEPLRAKGRLSDLSGPMVALAAALALLSASCCVLPLGLSILGLGGAWLAMLGPLVTYRPFVLVAAALVVVVAWVITLRKGQPKRLTVTLMTFATLSLLVAASAPLWERQATQVLWGYWLETR